MHEKMTPHPSHVFGEDIFYKHQTKAGSLSGPKLFTGPNLKAPNLLSKLAVTSEAEDKRTRPRKITQVFEKELNFGTDNTLCIHW